MKRKANTPIKEVKEITKKVNFASEKDIEEDEEEDTTQELYNSPNTKKNVTFKISPTIHCVSKQGDIELVNMKRNEVGLQLTTVAHSIVSVQELRRQDTIIATTDLSTEVFSYLRSYFLPVKGFNYALNEPSHEWTEDKLIPMEKILKLCVAVKDVMKRDASLLRLESPTYVFGDLHGNYEDLLFFQNMCWKVGINIALGNFLFLGDYVDRGPHSLEVSLYLLALKLKCPKKVFLLRGNHEDKDVNGDMNTYGEGSFLFQCIKLYGKKNGKKIFGEINDCFDLLPLAAVIDNKIFCVHGGLPRALVDSPNILDDISSIKRPPQLTSPLVNDLLWADPAKTNERKDLGSKGFHEWFGPNKRGENVCMFGPKAVENFLKKTGCTYIIRAHEKEHVGVSFTNKAKVLTVFSSSHYCGSGNMASCVLVSEGKLNVIMKQNNELGMEDVDDEDEEEGDDVDEEENEDEDD